MNKLVSKKILQVVLSLVVTFAANAMLVAEVVIQPTPDGGTQPRLIMDADGGVHLLYFKKRLRAPAAREGNLYYRQYSAEQQRFGNPVKVSSQAFNLHTFSIARAGVAVDGEGRIHVLWYLPKQSQFFYSRSNPSRDSFEPALAMVTEFDEGIDAGAEIAAIGNSVAVVWGAGDLSREYERTVYARISHDGGASFGPDTQLGNTDIGACACCSLAADFADSDTLQVAYRSAIDGVGRHMQLLTIELDAQASESNGITAASYQELSSLQEWDASFCPLSTNDIAIAANGERWLAFETEFRVMQLNMRSAETVSAVAEPFMETRQKNPAIAFNASNERLLVWGEAISHSRGGRMNIRLFDAAGAETGYELPEEINIPNYSFPAVAALPGGDFLVLY